MIANTLLDILYAFVWGVTRVVGSFGEVSANNAITTSLVNIKTYYTSLNDYLPIDTILAIALFSLTFETLFFTYKLIRWGYRKVPGIS